MKHTSPYKQHLASLAAFVGLALGILFFRHTVIDGADEFPSRPISHVVVWSAGGGTDIANRVVSAEMAKLLGQTVNVTNRPGGVAGSLGMSYVSQRPADGYTWVGISESCVTAGVMGGWQERMDIWYPMIIGGSPSVISVSSESSINSLTDLIAQAKQRTINAAAGGSGSIHHLNLLAFERGVDAPFKFVPFPGSAPAQIAAVTQEVDVVITTLAEQQQLISAGKLKPLAMLNESEYAFSEDLIIPSAFVDFPSLSEHLPVFQSIGMAISDDAPDEVKALLSEAFTQALQTPAVKTWADNNYFSLSGRTGDAAKEEFARLESLFTWTLNDMGVTKISPEALAIARPDASE